MQVQVSRVYSYIIWAGSALVLFFSVWLAYAKVLYVDNAYLLFNLINQKSFAIAHQRYIMLFFQFMPLAGVKLHLSVNTLIYLYAINLYLPYLVISWICAFVYKSPGPAIGVLLCLFVGTANEFFMTTEILHGIAFSFLLYVLLKKFDAEQALHTGVFTAMVVFLNVFGHPISLITTLFTIVHFMLESKSTSKLKKALLPFSLFFVFLLIKKITASPNSYEAGFYAELSAWKKHLFQLHNLYSTRFFFGRPAVYDTVRLFAALVALLLLMQRSYKMLAFYLVAWFGYFLLACIMFNKGDADEMMERVFLPLVFFSVLPFCTLLWKPGGFYATMSCILIGIGVANLLKISQTYTLRVRVLEVVVEHLQKEPGQKFYCNHTEGYQPEMRAPWALSIETLLLSTAQQQGKSVTYYLANGEELDMQNPDLFLGPVFWPGWSIKSQLDTTIFRLGTDAYYKCCVPVMIK